ncbi:hypothetical protein ACQ9ZF_12360 (plasmid) [Cetobacterium somerae]|uniref:hypothetical protein n=1 Tax=Cetobacterium somerae TaxID=188913 RepID=UPI003D76A29B
MGNLDRFKIEKTLREDIKKISLLGDLNIENYGGYEFIKKICEEYIKSTLFKKEEMSLLVSLFLVTFANQKYSDGNYWSNLYEELDIDQSYYIQLCKCFKKTLEYFDLEFIDTEYKSHKYLNNIIMHGYVPREYLGNFYDFIERFYKKDLHLKYENQLLKNELDFLKEQLYEDSQNIYGLLKATKLSLIYLGEIIDAFVENHIKIIDAFYWGNIYKISLPNHFINNFEIWLKKKVSINNKSETKKEYLKYQKLTINYFEPIFILDKNKVYLKIPKKKILYKYKDFQVNLVVNNKLYYLKNFLDDGILYCEEKIIEIGSEWENTTVKLFVGDDILLTWTYEKDYIIFNKNFKQCLKSGLYPGEYYIVCNSLENIYGDIKLSVINQNKLYLLQKNSEEDLIIKTLKNTHIFKFESTEYGILGLKNKFLSIDGNENIYKSLPILYFPPKHELKMLRLKINDSDVVEIEDAFSNLDYRHTIDLKKLLGNYEGSINIQLQDILLNKTLFNENIFISNFEVKFKRSFYHNDEEILFKVFNNSELNLKKQDGWYIYDENKNIVKIEEKLFKLEPKILYWKAENLKEWIRGTKVYSIENLPDKIYIKNKDLEDIYITDKDEKIIILQQDNYIDLTKFKFIFNNSLERETVLNLEFKYREYPYRIKLIKLYKDILIENFNINYSFKLKNITANWEGNSKKDFWVDIFNESTQTVIYTKKLDKNTKYFKERIELQDKYVYSLEIYNYEEIKKSVFSPTETVKISIFKYNKIFKL